MAGGFSAVLVVFGHRPDSAAFGFASVKFRVCRRWSRNIGDIKAGSELARFQIGLECRMKESEARIENANRAAGPAAHDFPPCSLFISEK